jgi:hypothetical protein
MQIINRTPHAITIHPSGVASSTSTMILPAAPRGEVARVETTAQVEAPIVCAAGYVPVASTSWGRVIGLAEPAAGVVQVVSVIVAAAAHFAGRDLADLYVSGDQVRDGSGRIVGCMALAPAASALPGGMLAWSPREHCNRMDDIAALLCYADDSGALEQPYGTRRRGRWPMQVHYIMRRPEAHGGGYVRVTQEWGTDDWAWTDIGVSDAAREYHIAGID